MKTDPNQSPEPHKPLLEVTLNRRQLYAAIASCMGAGAIAACAFTDIPQRLQQQGLMDRVISEVGQNRRNAVYTLAESIALWAGNMLVCNAMDARGVLHGTHAMDGAAAQEFADRYPIPDYLHKNFAMPLFEEALYRLLPSSLFSEEQSPDIKLHWATGLTANAVFSMIHNFSSRKPGEFTLTVDSLPLEQFLLGTYCWYVQRRGGFMHAAGAHMLYNNLCSAYDGYVDR